MLKLNLTMFLLLTATLARAVEVTVDDPCGDAPWMQTEFDAAQGVGESVGALTIAALESHAISYSGSEAGLSSIKDTPTGDAALEVVSDREMRAYGWCYHVNGMEPGLYPDEVSIESPTDKVKWFFAYALYVDGEWTEMCVPTNATRPAFICAPRR